MKRILQDYTKQELAWKSIYSVGGLGKVKKVIQAVDRNTIYFKYAEGSGN